MLKRSIVFMLDNIKYFQVDRIKLGKFDVTMEQWLILCFARKSYLRSELTEKDF